MNNPYRVLVFGATGNIGRRVATIAHERGHHVIGVSRRNRSSWPVPFQLIQEDARSLQTVRRLSQDVDVIVSATRPANGEEAELLATTRTLLEALRERTTRLVLVGGAARLLIPGTNRRVLDDSKLVQDAWHHSVPRSPLA